MDLESFIAETLRQIITGIKAAQRHEDCKGARINPEKWPAIASGYKEMHVIEFDVALTVSAGTEKQGKGNIGVASILGIGGQASSTSTNSSVSRIKFEIPVVLPKS